MTDQILYSTSFYKEWVVSNGVSRKLYCSYYFDHKELRHEYSIDIVDDIPSQIEIDRLRSTLAQAIILNRTK